ncbi:TPA: ABC transporter permease [Streptococcus suis]|nr:ABC transporter permease [Streptococcus suis]
MYKRFLALLWLRTQVLVTNKNILLPVLMPYFMLLLFKFVMKTDDTKAMDLMGICFSMAIGMSVGSPISAMISEEKEKNNLSTLLLTGVRSSEYVLSILCYPVVISFVNLILFPAITQADVSGYMLSYSVIMLLTSLASILINLLIGATSQSQSKSQVTSMIITMAVSMGPSLSLMNETVGQILKYSFLGAYIEFFKNPHVEIWNQELYYLLGWIVLISLTLILYLGNWRKYFKNRLLGLKEKIQYSL